MSKIVSTEVFQYQELSEEAKAKARDWYRNASMEDSDFADAVIEDAVRMGELLGVEFATHEVTLVSGKKRHDPSVWWSLGYDQNDFAAIEGFYRNASDAVARITEETGGSDGTLLRLAERLAALQEAFGGKLTAVLKNHHYYGFQVEAEALGADEEPMDISVDQDTELREIFRTFNQWIYNRLRAENEYQMADEQVVETIEANEYWFEANGRRARND